MKRNVVDGIRLDGANGRRYVVFAPPLWAVHRWAWWFARVLLDKRFEHGVVTVGNVSLRVFEAKS